MNKTTKTVLEEQQLYILVEIPKGDNNKYEFDQKTKKVFIKRTTHFHSPNNYGFICDREGNSITLSEDGDDIDVLCLGDPLVPNCIVPIKVIGALIVVDNNKRDDKILAVNANDNKWNHLEDLKDCKDFINPVLEEISSFLDRCKDWKKKEDDPKNTTVGEWVGKKEALQIIEKGLSLYQKNKE